MAHIVLETARATPEANLATCPVKSAMGGESTIRSYVRMTSLRRFRPFVE
jgi:hypothetical protein